VAHRFQVLVVDCATAGAAKKAIRAIIEWNPRTDDLPMAPVQG